MFNHKDIKMPFLPKWKLERRTTSSAPEAADFSFEVQHDQGPSVAVTPPSTPPPIGPYVHVHPYREPLPYENDDDASLVADVIGMIGPDIGVANAWPILDEEDVKACLGAVEIAPGSGKNVASVVPASERRPLVEVRRGRPSDECAQDPTETLPDSWWRECVPRSSSDDATDHSNGSRDTAAAVVNSPMPHGVAADVPEEPLIADHDPWTPVDLVSTSGHFPFDHDGSGKNVASVVPESERRPLVEVRRGRPSDECAQDPTETLPDSWWRECVPRSSSDDATDHSNGSRDTAAVLRRGLESIDNSQGGENALHATDVHHAPRVIVMQQLQSPTNPNGEILTSGGLEVELKEEHSFSPAAQRALLSEAFGQGNIDIQKEKVRTSTEVPAAPSHEDHSGKSTEPDSNSLFDIEEVVQLAKKNAARQGPIKKPLPPPLKKVHQGKRPDTPRPLKRKADAPFDTVQSSQIASSIIRGCPNCPCPTCRSVHGGIVADVCSADWDSPTRLKCIVASTPKSGQDQDENKEHVTPSRVDPPFDSIAWKFGINIDMAKDFPASSHRLFGGVNRRPSLPGLPHVSVSLSSESKELSAVQGTISSKESQSSASFVTVPDAPLPPPKRLRMDCNPMMPLPADSPYGRTQTEEYLPRSLPRWEDVFSCPIPDYQFLPSYALPSQISPDIVDGIEASASPEGADSSHVKHLEDDPTAASLKPLAKENEPRTGNVSHSGQLAEVDPAVDPATAKASLSPFSDTVNTRSFGELALSISSNEGLSSENENDGQSGPVPRASAVDAVSTMLLERGIVKF